MIEIIQQYWQSYLWTDGFQMTGVAMTAWLLVLSIAIGFVLAVPLSIARVSEHAFVRGPVWFFTYIFRGTPLYGSIDIPCNFENIRHGCSEGNGGCVQHQNDFIAIKRQCSA